MSDHDPTEPPPRDPCGAARPVLLPVPEDYAPPVALVFGADGLAAAPRPVAIVVTAGGIVPVYRAGDFRDPAGDQADPGRPRPWCHLCASEELGVWPFCDGCGAETCGECIAHGPALSFCRLCVARAGAT